MSEKKYLAEDFKKEKPPTFYGEMKGSQYEEVWFLGMKKLFKLHEYLENIKSKIATFSVKGKADI